MLIPSIIDHKSLKDAESAVSYEGHTFWLIGCDSFLLFQIVHVDLCGNGRCLGDMLAKARSCSARKAP